MLIAEHSYLILINNFQIYRRLMLISLSLVSFIKFILTCSVLHVLMLVFLKV